MSMHCRCYYSHIVTVDLIFKFVHFQNFSRCIQKSSRSRTNEKSESRKQFCNQFRDLHVCHISKMTDKTKQSLLVIIVDTNTAWWGNLRQDQDEQQLSLSRCIDAITVMANSHLMLAHKNKLAVIAAHTDYSAFLYPRPLKETKEQTKINEEGQYEVFTQVECQLKHQIKKLIAKDKDRLDEMMEELPSNCLVAGAMAMALCYIHRMEKECPIGDTLLSRILIVKGSQDCPTQYMNFMNAIFTAQKENILIDACVLDSESGLLQQACDITGGIYLRIPQPGALLQYLLWVFLPDPTTRTKMALPPKDQVDYRAACFCHRNLVDIGYVCSVCLSIYCSFSPICSTCQTTFKILGPQKLMKKKGKKIS